MKTANKASSPSSETGYSVWEENFGLSKAKQAKLTRFYVLHYAECEDMCRAVSTYFGNHYSEAVRLHNQHYNVNIRRCDVCYITTSKETADKWVKDTLDTSKIHTLVI